MGLGISCDWSSHTGAGSRNGGFGTGGNVDVGGIIGPVFVFQSTLIATVLDKYVKAMTKVTNWHWNEQKKKKTKINTKKACLYDTVMTDDGRVKNELFNRQIPIIKNFSMKKQWHNN